MVIAGEVSFALSAISWSPRRLASGAPTDV
jgi:hypothetical protein